VLSGGGPTVETAPLPSGAQFLNVIESVFSGLARSIIHNSDYKARFSQIREPVGDDEKAGCCQQRIDNDRQSVVPAIEALVGE
jgi:hypothetical protein